MFWKDWISPQIIDNEEVLGEDAINLRDSVKIKRGIDITLPVYVYESRVVLSDTQKNVLDMEKDAMTFDVMANEYEKKSVTMLLDDGENKSLSVELKSLPGSKYVCSSQPYLLNHQQEDTKNVGCFISMIQHND